MSVTTHLITLVVTGVGSFIGAYVSYQFTIFKNNRELVHKDLQELSDLVGATSDTAVEYWSKDFSQHEGMEEERKKLEAEIAGDIHGVAKLIDNLFPTHTGPRAPIEDALRAFRFSCTLGTFGQTGRAADISRLENIHKAKRTLQALLKKHRKQITF